jgi:hypothetical protein
MDVNSQKQSMIRLDLEYEVEDTNEEFGYLLVRTNDRKALDSGPAIVKSTNCGWNCKNGVQLKHP